MSASIPAPVRAVLHRLRAAGYEAWLVGGCVRDALMGRQPGDYDLATSALPGEVEAALPGYAVLPTGLRHGTVTVLAGGMPLEITTYRVETGYADHRHPDGVRFTPSLTEDLARRDFTVNAMAWDGGQVVDPFGGREDLRQGLIRCVGEPEERFQEDALRILRALRFAACLGFAIDPRTAAALSACQHLIPYVARERIAVELSKLLCGPGAGRVLEQYGGPLAAVDPRFAPLLAAAPEWARRCRRVDEAPPRLPLRWAALLRGCPEAEELLGGLRLDRATLRAASRLAVPLPGLPAGEADLLRLLRDLGEPLALDALELARADAVAGGGEAEPWIAALTKTRALLARGACYRLGQLAVTGTDLTALGLSGPRVGRTLDALLEAVIGGALPNDRAALLRAVCLGLGQPPA